MIREPSAQDVVVSRPPRRHGRIAAGVALAAIALAGLAFLTLRWADTTQSVNASRLRVATVARGTLVRDAAVNGRVVAAVSPTVYAPAMGAVTLKVAAGATVKKGEVLAEIESPDLRDALKREESSYEQMEAELARQRILARKQELLARRDADTAEIERVSAQRTYDRIEKAGLAGVVAKIDFAKAQDALKSAEIRSRHAVQAAALESDDVALELKTKAAQLARQKLALDYARRRVDELTVRAPVAGFVGSLAVADRSVVPANAPLLTLVDLSVLEVELEIPESYVNDLGLGMTAEITLPDGKATGTLSAIAPEVVRNQVLARVRFTGAQPPGLRQSQRVAARVLIDERRDVLTLPRGPFVETEGGRYAYVVTGNVAERRSVRLGATSVSAVEVVDGLKAGDQVVVAGTDAFAHAERITLNP